MFSHLFQFWLLSIVLSSSLHHSLDKLLIFSLQCLSYPTFTSICLTLPLRPPPEGVVLNHFLTLSFKCVILALFHILCRKIYELVLPSCSHYPPPCLLDSSSCTTYSHLRWPVCLQNPSVELVPPRCLIEIDVGCAGVSLLYINQLTSLCLICLYEWC